MLSRRLHEQVFPHKPFPAPPDNFLVIAREHLSLHGLDPNQSSKLPDIGFTLPPLQGKSIDEHFYNIGHDAAEPYLSLAKSFMEDSQLRKPTDWELTRSGWTRYECGSTPAEDYCVRVEQPDEQLLCFDVETMPHISPYAVMATARSPTHWYSWISPWLLGETEELEQFIPMGDNSKPRIVIGHNVSYDRQRIADEYSLKLPTRRFLDTMSLHVAVKGISSHQRPAWNKWKKQKREADESDLVDSISEIQNGDDPSRWEELTSANSLVDVAALHCGIHITKEVRNDIMTATRQEVHDDLERYLAYCASDVETTYKVYCAVLPKFLASCPSPVSFAGILTMGSAFLPVNQEWERYLRNAESMFRAQERVVQDTLNGLAREAIQLWNMEDPDQNETVQPWKDDVWLAQLDWTPKKTRTLKAKSKFVGQVPSWYAALSQKPLSTISRASVLPFILQARYYGYPLFYTQQLGWVYAVERGSCSDEGAIECPELDEATGGRYLFYQPFRKGVKSLLSVSNSARLLGQGKLSLIDNQLGLDVTSSSPLDANAEQVIAQLLTFAREVVERGKPEPVPGTPKGAPGDDTWWGDQLDWEPAAGTLSTRKAPMLPTWYHELLVKGTTSGKDYHDEGEDNIELTVRSRVAPLLLRLNWRGFPLFHLRQHGWSYRVPQAETSMIPEQEKPLALTLAHDLDAVGSMLEDYVFYKLPHKDGEEANVGSPLAKPFMKYAIDGVLASPSEGARQALDLNAQCSYWISARDRVMNQMVVWDKPNLAMGMDRGGELKADEKWGIILPQVITMGTVTRRCIERTWLTASNAKPNRIGSELKAMVRAPPGYAIVGADVDSEELWISSVMGDAQFGQHGATAIGWMTLEGTKAAGTDLHSNTANILGISRNYAKVFNYSRIYGAGMKHAALLLLQSNTDMTMEEAQERAVQLYAKTKGRNTQAPHMFGRKFWFGGSESYLFNKLEEIAMSDRPQTPALGCGVTDALAKEYLPQTFGSDYLPSRINWVVQSSGVDYLHLLIVSMDFLLKKYDIKARYLISVHDELRYLVEEKDKYRAALALQIANMWTRCQFAYKLGIDDLPQGVAFFSAVDIDWLLRKEVDMPCITPSQSIALAPGESLDIQGVLEKTNGGSLWPEGQPMDKTPAPGVELQKDYTAPDCLVHRAKTTHFLKAQATQELGEVKLMASSAGKLERRSYSPPARPPGHLGKVKTAPATRKATKS